MRFAFLRANPNCSARDEMNVEDLNEFEWFDLWCEQHSHLLEAKNYPQLVQRSDALEFDGQYHVVQRR